MAIYSDSGYITGRDTPLIRPTLDLNFAKEKRLDSRVLFTRGSSGTYTDENGVIRTAANNVPRFDHDPTTGESLGLLIEEQRTNRFANSTTYGGSGWTKQSVANLTTNTTDVVAPDGSFTATRWEPTTTLSQYIYTSTNGSLGSSTFTMSVWVRTPAGESTNFTMNLYAPTQGPGASFFTATDTWQRFSWTFTAQSQTTAYPVAINQLNKVLYIWGPQLELGSFPTSYIPTSGSTVTRAADLASISGTNFSEWYNPTEGTFVINSIKSLFTSGVQSLIGTDQKYFDIAVTTGGINVRIGIASPDLSITSSDTNLKVAMGYESSTHSMSLNGAAAVNDTHSSGLPNNTILYIGRGNGNNYEFIYSGSIGKLTYFSKKLSNTQLQALTS